VHSEHARSSSGAGVSKELGVQSEARIARVHVGEGVLSVASAKIGMRAHEEGMTFSSEGDERLVESRGGTFEAFYENADRQHIVLLKLFQDTHLNGAYQKLQRLILVAFRPPDLQAS
jgi:hypothetical protein